jgi:hypothetical protein
LLLGAILFLFARFQHVDDEKQNKKPALACSFSVIQANTHPMAASSGFEESHNPPPLGNVPSIVPAHRHGHQNDQQCLCIILLLLC